MSSIRLTDEEECLINLTEYVRQSGSEPMKWYNFNGADMLVLTALSYVNFLSSVSGDFRQETQLAEAINKLFTFSLVPVRNAEFLLAVRDSCRYSGLSVCGYRDEKEHQANAMQFSALTIKIRDDQWFISYSGTDGTIPGWEEDFQFSYLLQTPAQKKALEYLTEAAACLKGNFIVGGHSKGGNLAAYACIFADRAIQGRISNVYCYDAPGFNEGQDILNHEQYKHLEDRICCIIPQGSIVGQLLQTFPDECFRVINSVSESLLGQHDMFSWQVDASGNLSLCQDTTPSTKRIMTMINEWIRRVSISRREHYVNMLFNILKSRNIKTVGELIPYLPVNP